MYTQTAFWGGGWAPTGQLSISAVLTVLYLLAPITSYFSVFIYFIFFNCSIAMHCIPLPSNILRVIWFFTLYLVFDMVYLVLGTVYFVFGMVYLIFGTVQLISWTRVRRRQMEGWHVSLSASRPIRPLLPACSIAHGRIVDWLDWSKLPLHTIHRIPAGGETLKVSSIWLPNLMISLILICRSPILYSSILYFDTQMTEKYSTAMC